MGLSPLEACPIEALASFAATATPAAATTEPVRLAVVDTPGCVLGGVDSEVAQVARAALHAPGRVPLTGHRPPITSRARSTARFGRVSRSACRRATD